MFKSPLYGNGAGVASGEGNVYADGDSQTGSDFYPQSHASGHGMSAADGLGDDTHYCGTERFDGHGKDTCVKTFPKGHNPGPFDDVHF